MSSIKAAIICANQIYNGFDWWKRGESNPLVKAPKSAQI
nr:MAG TPA: hypothetical protein [Caudoviricetes sp.]